MASEVELLEVFRLGELAGNAEIVRVVGDRLVGSWLGSSRFRETDALTRRSLALHHTTGQTPPAATLRYAARSRRVLGFPHDALALYDQALTLDQTNHDRAGEAATRPTSAGCTTVWGTARQHYGSSTRRSPYAAKSATAPAKRDPVQHRDDPPGRGPVP